jgi:hypothetical protein
MNIIRAISLAFALFLHAGCQTYNANEDVAARIDGPTDASRAELQHSVNSAFGTEVLLADDALTESSVLSIERSVPGSIQNPQPQGRDYSMPTKFHLVKRGTDCFLIDTRNDTRYLLDSTNCVAE